MNVASSMRRSWQNSVLSRLLTILLITLFYLIQIAMQPTSVNAQSNFGYELISPPGITTFTGGDATEISGITYSGTTNSLFVVSDGNGTYRAIYEFSLAGQYVRKISVNIGGLTDMEGISWMYGNRFVIASEDQGDLYVVDVASGSTVVNSAVYTVGLSIAEDGADNYGLEGVAYDQSSPAGSERFYVVDEQNTAGLAEVRHVSYATSSGTVSTLSTFTIPNSVAPDFSGIYHSAVAQKLYLLSEMNDAGAASIDKVFEMNLSGEILSSLTLTGFDKAEGLTFMPDMSEMIIAGEERQYAHFERTATTFESSVTSGSDDAEQNLATGQMNLASGDLDLGLDDGNAFKVGVIFRTVSIPADAQIVSAVIEFTSDEPNVEATTITIQGINQPNAPTFSAATNDISSRPVTSASQSWQNVPPFSQAGIQYQTPDLSAIVQEIIDSGSWNSGNAIGFVIDGTDQRAVDSYEGEVAPKLIISYQGSPTDQALQSLPTGTITQTNPAFVWQQVNNATAYRVVIYDLANDAITDDQNFSAGAVCGVITCSAKFANLVLPAGSYKWLVRPQNSYGNGPWSVYP